MEEVVVSQATMAAAVAAVVVVVVVAASKEQETGNAQTRKCWFVNSHHIVKHLQLRITNYIQYTHVKY